MGRTSGRESRIGTANRIEIIAICLAIICMMWVQNSLGSEKSENVWEFDLGEFQDNILVEIFYYEVKFELEKHGDHVKKTSSKNKLEKESKRVVLIRSMENENKINIIGDTAIVLLNQRVSYFSPGEVLKDAMKLKGDFLKRVGMYGEEGGGNEELALINGKATWRDLYVYKIASQYDYEIDCDEVKGWSIDDRTKDEAMKTVLKKVQEKKTVDLYKLAKVSCAPERLEFFSEKGFEEKYRNIGKLESIYCWGNWEFMMGDLREYYLKHGKKKTIAIMEEVLRDNEKECVSLYWISASALMLYKVENGGKEFLRLAKTAIEKSWELDCANETNKYERLKETILELDEK